MCSATTSTASPPGATRARHFVVTGDCTAHGASCFCTMLGQDPWPDDGYDLNLSPVEGGWIVEAGSDRGRSLLDAHPERFRSATTAEIAARDRRRAEVRAGVVKQNERFPVREPLRTSVGKNRRSRIWGELAATCVECNACNLACPTCHCFLLRELKGPDAVCSRLSLWDSCFSAGYARMAGGGTPRLQLVERFRNHYFHKFVTFPEVWGVTACTGCGRCIDACMGRIDKRRCLHDLETRWIPSEQVAEVG